MLTTIHLAHLPPELALHVALYQDLQNAPFLREQLIAGNSEFEYAFVDASMALSTTHIFAAAFRAMCDHLHGRLKSRNIHSEIVFALSSNNNIAESFRKFGISNDTKELLVLKVSISPHFTTENVQKHLDDVIKGTSLPFDDDSLGKVRDLAKIRKAYKLPDPWSKGRQKAAFELVNGDDGVDMDREQKELEVAILGAIALRGAT